MSDQPKKGYFFLCNHETESDCLNRQLVGTTQANIEWALNIAPGDCIFLYNFQTGSIWGPFQAASKADCYEQRVWNGSFPVQVRLNKTAESRKANLIESGRREFLIARGHRPPNIVEDRLLSSLLSFMVEKGTVL